VDDITTGILRTAPAELNPAATPAQCAMHRSAVSDYKEVRKAASRLCDLMVKGMEPEMMTIVFPNGDFQTLVATGDWKSLLNQVKFCISDSVAPLARLAQGWRGLVEVKSKGAGDGEWTKILCVFSICWESIQSLLSAADLPLPGEK
jgi:hypothetical protein